MNENFLPLNLPRPEIADRRKETPRFLPMPPEVIARRGEIARLLGVKIDAVAKSIRQLSDEERKAVFVKLEHDGKIPLGGTGLKPISEPSDRFTLAVPMAGNLDKLKKKVEEFGKGPLKNGQASNQTLAVLLKDIKQGDPKDRLSQELFEEYGRLIRRKFLIIEVEIVSLQIGRNQQRQEIAERLIALETFLKEDQPYGTIFEHEEIKGTCRAVIRCSGAAFKRLVEEIQWQTIISWFDARPQFETFTATLDNFNVGNLGPLTGPPAGASIVCVVDSGVTVENPFLKPVVREDLLRSFLKDEKDIPFDLNGHGSGVASLVAYYALNLADGAANEGKVWVAGARVLDKDNQGDERLFSTVLTGVVETFAPLGIRIFNLSVNILNRMWNAEAKRTVSRRSWVARTIDCLSRKHDIIFVVSTGNIFNDVIRAWGDDGKGYPAYFTEEEARILDPGQAALALTVGAVARNTLAIGPRIATSIAEQSQPSPFTRTGPGIRREIKPELVDFGGNLLQDPQGGAVRANPGTSIMMASPKATPAIANNRGTSFAAPRVSHKLGLVLSDLQSLGLASVSAPLLKAFLVNSATYAGLGDEYDSFVEALDGVQAKHWRQVLGYGIPDHIRATYSDDYSALLYFQGELEPDKVAYFDVPVPACLADSANCKKRLTVTVVHYPEVQRWGLEDYLGTSLKWRLFRGDIDRNEVIEAMSAEEEEERSDEDTDVGDDDGRGTEQSGRPKELKYKYGLTIRSRGTVQHDVIEWTNHKAEFSENHYTLAIAAYGKWANKAVPYAVVVRIEDDGRTARVNAEVSELLAQIEVRARGRG